MKKATFTDVLQFINQEEVVTALDLMEKFGYTRGGADTTFAWLKRKRLIINDMKGQWTITDTGISRLIYKGRL